GGVSPPSRVPLGGLTPPARQAPGMMSTPHCAVRGNEKEPAQPPNRRVNQLRVGGVGTGTFTGNPCNTATPQRLPIRLAAACPTHPTSRLNPAARTGRRRSIPCPS